MTRCGFTHRIVPHMQCDIRQDAGTGLCPTLVVVVVVIRCVNHTASDAFTVIEPVKTNFKRMSHVFLL